jgi:hypothetical protein
MLPAHPFLAYTSALTHLLTFGSKETKPAPWVSGGKTGPSYLIHSTSGFAHREIGFPGPHENP